MNKEELLICPYCNKEAKFCESKEIYGKNYGKSYMVYLCKKCDAYVGTHNNTRKPFGTMAKKDLRNARHQCHLLLDPLWKKEKDGNHNKGSRGKKRKELYKFIADKMGIDYNDMHFGMFNIEQCREAYVIIYNNLINK